MPCPYLAVRRSAGEKLPRRWGGFVSPEPTPQPRRMRRLRRIRPANDLRPISDLRRKTRPPPDRPGTPCSAGEHSTRRTPIQSPRTPPLARVPTAPPSGGSRMAERDTGHGPRCRASRGHQPHGEGHSHRRTRRRGETQGRRLRSAPRVGKSEEMTVNRRQLRGKFLGRRALRHHHLTTGLP